TVRRCDGLLAPLDSSHAGSPKFAGRKTALRRIFPIASTIHSEPFIGLPRLRTVAIQFYAEALTLHRSEWEYQQVSGMGRRLRPAFAVSWSRRVKFADRASEPHTASLLSAFATGWFRTAAAPSPPERPGGLRRPGWGRKAPLPGCGAD